MATISSPKIIDKASAIHLIDSSKKPVLFWDTCVLLDIIRLPIPERGHSVGTLDRIIEIKNQIAGGNVIGLSSIMCVDEYNDHIDNYLRLLMAETDKLSSAYNKFIGFINKAIGAPTLSSIDLRSHKIEDLLLAVIEAITKEIYFIEESQSFADFAHYRTRYKIPPAKKKGEYKDCYIWGTCLEVRQASADRSYPYQFLSSNVKDYADETKDKFVTELAHEASMYNITYFPDFNKAYWEMKSAGIV